MKVDESLWDHCKEIAESHCPPKNSFAFSVNAPFIGLIQFKSQGKPLVVSRLKSSLIACWYTGREGTEGSDWSYSLHSVFRLSVPFERVHLFFIKLVWANTVLKSQTRSTRHSWSSALVWQSPFSLWKSQPLLHSGVSYSALQKCYIYFRSSTNLWFPVCLGRTFIVCSPPRNASTHCQVGQTVQSHKGWWRTGEQKRAVLWRKVYSLSRAVFAINKRRFSFS